jgi:hypothetical protein
MFSDGRKVDELLRNASCNEAVDLQVRFAVKTSDEITEKYLKQILA